ncbi:MAG: hypothetical protein K6E83_05600, partial [Clostridium sp.]|nr:hypothetical protein [Clostridium sp.]
PDLVQRTAVAGGKLGLQRIVSEGNDDGISRILRVVELGGKLDDESGNEEEGDFGGDDPAYGDDAGSGSIFGDDAGSGSIFGDDAGGGSVFGDDAGYGSGSVFGEATWHDEEPEGKSFVEDDGEET